MRIIAGQCGGAQLYAPRGMDTRPTQDKVKESLFSIIQAYVPGARVLDLFAGSGTTMIAAEQNGRSAYCMELDPQYVDVIIDRWERFTGQKAKKEA